MFFTTSKPAWITCQAVGLPVVVLTMSLVSLGMGVTRLAAQEYGLNPSALDSGSLNSGALNPSAFATESAFNSTSAFATEGADSEGQLTLPSLGSSVTPVSDVKSTTKTNDQPKPETDTSKKSKWGIAKFTDDLAKLRPVSVSMIQPADETETVQASATVSDSTEELDFLDNRLSELDRQIAILRARKRSGGTGRITAGRPRAFVSFESVLLQPAQSNTSALIIETEADSYAQVMFPWEIKHSPRISFGYDSGSDSLGWRMRFWQFRHTEKFEASVDNGLIPFGSDVVVGFLEEANDVTVGLQFIESGEFISHIRTDVIDWEISKRLTPSVQLFSGLRYAKVRQGYVANTDVGKAWADSQFRGIGPTVSLQFEHRLPLERLMLFSNVRGSLLFGHKDFSAIDDNDQYLQQLNEIDPRGWEEGADSLAGNMEIQLGLQWDITRWFNLRVALEVQHFDSVGGANPTATATGPTGGISTDSPLDDNLSLFGLSIASEWAY